MKHFGTKEEKVHGRAQMEGRKDSFAHGLNFYKLAFIFIIGCLVGYCVEMLWCYLRLGYFESRQGLIYGPFSPVYGMGAIIFTVLLYRFRHSSSFVIFIASGVIGGAFEYVCSLLQQVLFGTVSWEYSDSPLNIHGRTNVFYSVCWGVLGLIFLTHTLPFLTNLIEKIPNRPGKAIAWVLIAFMIFDIVISAAAVRRQTNRHLGVPANNPVSAFLDEHYTDDYLKKVYPNMQLAG